MPALQPASETTESLTAVEEVVRDEYALYPGASTFPGPTTYPGVFTFGLALAVVSEGSETLTPLTED